MQLLLKPYSSTIAFLVVSSIEVIVAFTKSTLETNKMSVRLKNVIFVVFNVYKLYKIQLVSLGVELLDGKDTPVVLFKTRR